MIKCHKTSTKGRGEGRGEEKWEEREKRCSEVSSRILFSPSSFSGVISQQQRREHTLTIIMLKWINY